MRYLLFTLALLPALHAALPPIPTNGLLMAVDPQGHIWYAGSTSTPFFTATSGVVQPTIAGGTDIFLIRLNRDGTEVEAATYLGGAKAESVDEISFGSNGMIFLRGVTGSTEFLRSPLTPPNDPTNTRPLANVFIAKLTRELDKLEYVQKLGSDQVRYNGLAVAGDGSAITAWSWCGVRGQNCTSEAVRLDPLGNSSWQFDLGHGYPATGVSAAPDGETIWATAGGTSVRIRISDGKQLAIAPLPTVGFSPVVALADGGALVVHNFEGTARISRMSADGVLIRETRIGGMIRSLSPGPAGNVLVTGAGSFSVPVSERSLARCASATDNRFVLVWNVEANGAEFGTYLPGTTGPVAVRDDAILSLQSQPIATIVSLRPADLPLLPPCLSGPAVNTAAMIPAFLTPELNFLAPGEFVDLYGSGIGPSDEIRIEMDGRRTGAPRVIDDTRVLFNGIPAALIFAGPNKVTAQVPYELQGAVKAVIGVERAGVSIGPIEMNVARARPALLSGAVYNADWSRNGYQNPAEAGDVISLFVSGGGRLLNIQDDSAALPYPAPLAELPISASIDGIAQEVTFAGGVPGQLPGLLQVNVRVTPARIYYPGMRLLLSFGDQQVITELSVRPPK